MLISSMATRAAALLRKSVHAATVDLNGEESEELFFSRKHRLKTFKLAFFFLTFFLQTGDAISDVVTECTYFLRDGGGNSTAAPSQLKMGEVFDTLYAVHGLASLLVSSYILREVFTVARYMYEARQLQSSSRSDEAPSGDAAAPRKQHGAAASKSTKRSWKNRKNRLLPTRSGKFDPAVHRAAAQLHGEKAAEQAADGDGNHLATLQVDDGVSVSSNPLAARGKSQLIPRLIERRLPTCWSKS